jgi:hypothetical protein
MGEFDGYIRDGGAVGEEFDHQQENDKDDDVAEQLDPAEVGRAGGAKVDVYGVNGE